MATVNELMDRAMALRISAAKIVHHPPTSFMETALELIGSGIDATDINRMVAEGFLYGADCLEADARNLLRSGPT